MKKSMLLFVALIVLSINGIYAQKGAPSTAISTLKQKFPEAKKVKWEKEKNGDFEAHFKVNNAAMSATFSPTGAWRETESTIPVSALPASVAAAFAKEHAGAKIKAADKIESETAITYEIEYKDGLKTREIVYDAQGVVVK